MGGAQIAVGNHHFPQRALPALIGLLAKAFVDLGLGQEPFTYYKLSKKNRFPALFGNGIGGLQFLSLDFENRRVLILRKHALVHEVPPQRHGSFGGGLKLEAVVQLLLRTELPTHDNLAEKEI